MNRPEDPELPHELKRVVARLEAGRAQADPLRLDQIKRTVIARGSAGHGGFGFMKSRLATIFTAAALVGGTGGAVAIGNSASHGGSNRGAASGQYCNGKTAGPGKCKGHQKHPGHCNKKGQGRGNGLCKGHNKGKKGKKGKNGAVKGITQQRTAGASLTG